MFQKAKATEEGEIADAEQLSMLDGEGNILDTPETNEALTAELEADSDNEAPEAVNQEASEIPEEANADEGSAEDDIIDL